MKIGIKIHDSDFHYHFMFVMESIKTIILTYKGCDLRYDINLTDKKVIASAVNSLANGCHIITKGLPLHESIYDDKSYLYISDKDVLFDSEVDEWETDPLTMHELYVLDLSNGNSEFVYRLIK